jgi:uncharacterized protein involved in exopolysaccharide biosynthesis
MTYSPSPPNGSERAIQGRVRSSWDEALSLWKGLLAILGRILFGPATPGHRVRNLTSSEPDETDSAQDATINLARYVETIRIHIRKILVFATAAVLLGVGYLHVATYLYTATLQVTPVEGSRDTLTSPGVSSLASLAGINLPGGQGQSQMQLYLAALNSSETGAELARQPAITHALFAGQWDEEHHTWREPKSMLGGVSSFIKSALGFPPRASWHPPDAESLMGVVENSVSVDYKPTSPIATITYKNRDPEFARQFLLALHNAADQQLRERALARATKYIEYLSKQLESVTSAEHREALIQAMSDQETKRMAASASVSYSVDVFSPPTVTTTPTDPRPTVVLIAAFLVGIMAGIVFVLLRY